jgi:hypothetical protein
MNRSVGKDERLSELDCIDAAPNGQAIRTKLWRPVALSSHIPAINSASSLTHIGTNIL